MLRNTRKADLMFRPLEISDKELFDDFSSDVITHSQYNFTNLFMWKHEYNPQIAVVDNCLCVVLNYFGHTMAMYPCGDGNVKSALNKVFDTFGRITVTALDESKAQRLKELFPGVFKYVNVRKNYDYIYSTEKLINLSGRKLHSKRNHLKRFLSKYDYEYQTISKELIDDCIKIERRWLDNKGFVGSVASSELRSTMNLLENYDYLRCKGGIIYVNKIPCAYSIGEVMRFDTAVIHIEKAVGDYEGIYAAINNLVVTNEFSDTLFINREEDMGHEALRKAKLSYYPDILLEYKRARFKR